MDRRGISNGTGGLNQHSGGHNWSRGLYKFELDSRWTSEKNQENLDDLNVTLRYASEKGTFDLKDLVL